MRVDEQPETGSRMQPQPARHASSSRSRRWYFGIPAVLTLAVVGGLIVYLIGGGQPHSVASAAGSASGGSSSAGASAIPAVRAKPATVIPHGGESGRAALTALGSNSLPLPKKATTSAKAWNVGQGGAELSAVTSDLGVVMQDAGMRNYVPMKAACKTLAAQVQAAQASPPIPDASMQALYGKALAELANGAAACQTAIAQRADGDEYDATTENQAGLHQATSAFDMAGSKDIYLGPPRRSRPSAAAEHWASLPSPARGPGGRCHTVNSGLVLPGGPR